jgi:hypothetical protein
MSGKKGKKGAVKAVAAAAEPVAVVEADDTSSAVADTSADTTSTNDSKAADSKDVVDDESLPNPNFRLESMPIFPYLGIHRQHQHAHDALLCFALMR